LTRYVGYGLCLESEIALPLPPIHSTVALPVIAVRFGGFDASEALSLPYAAGAVAYGPYSGRVLVRTEGLPDFLVSGSCILIGDHRAEAELGDIVVRMVLGFVLQLRSIMAFHGAAACRHGRAVALLGDRAAGKSTTAMGLAERGWGFLCDDIVAVEPEGNVPAGATRARLNSDSYDRLGDGRHSGPAPRDRDGKYSVQPGSEGRAAALESVFVIEAAEVETVESRAVLGYAKLRVALAHMHSLSGIGDPGTRLRRAAETLELVPLFVVRRPRRRFALDELLDTIEALSLREDP
jgi:hypothetical protein